MVEKASGVTGPAAAASRIATTLRASSTVEMNGISRRSNRRSGNWISSALPMVSALMPVLSERKNTGTAARLGGRAARTGSWLVVMSPSGSSGAMANRLRPVCSHWY